MCCFLCHLASLLQSCLASRLINSRYRNYASLRAATYTHHTDQRTRRKLRTSHPMQSTVTITPKKAQIDKKNHQECTSIVNSLWLCKVDAQHAAWRRQATIANTGAASKCDDVAVFSSGSKSRSTFSDNFRPTRFQWADWVRYWVMFCVLLPLPCILYRSWLFQRIVSVSCRDLIFVWACLYAFGYCETYTCKVSHKKHSDKSLRNFCIAAARRKVALCRLAWSALCSYYMVVGL
jgi:hypothetical protein